MARKVLYRRSFHAERDLKGVESLLGLDCASAAPKLSVDTRASTSDGGFEAPRNSLDVPFSGLLEMRRNSEVRSEEIPVGYELSKSLTTTRKRNEEYSSVKPLVSTNDQSHLKSKYGSLKISSEFDHKHRAPSVVARLMGLEALPHNKERLDGSDHSLSRRVQPRACTARPSLPSSVPALAFERDVSVEDHSKEKLSYGELSFRSHPQERQLQEFKRDFRACQTSQERHSMARLNAEGLQKKEQLLRLEPQIDSDEFLDALDFLNANKDFFVKVLNDPHSSFAKHENGPSRHVVGKLARRTSEHSCHFTEWKKKQDICQCSATDKSKALCNSRWGQDEEMPGRPRLHARRGSTRSSERIRLDQILPIRIVVLKPNLAKEAYSRKPSPMSNSPSPFLYSEVRYKGKENVKQEVKERTQLRNEVGLVREYRRDEKDGSKYAQAIAKQTVKHAEEDKSQRLLKDGLYIMGSVVPVSCSNGRKAAAQKIGGDASDIIDREGCYRMSRDNGKLCSSLPHPSKNDQGKQSLPSLPHPSKNDQENEHRQSGFNGRRGLQLDETKRSSHKHLASFSKSSREPSKFDEGSILGNQESCIKKSVRDSKMLRKTGQSSSFNLRELKCDAPRVLPRSLSAPAAPCVENRTVESEKKGGTTTMERVTCPIKARPAENPPFKERLLSLKDSFSLNKKRGSKKLSPPLCSTPLDLPDLTPPGQLDLEPVGATSIERKEPCHFVPEFEQQTAFSANRMAKEITEKSMDEALSDSIVTPPGLHQWTSIMDVADTASEASLDKCEQPSPVSVLEIPFQEERPSSVGKKEIDYKCHEHRCGLSHFTLDHKDLPQNLHKQLFSQAPCSCHSSFGSSADESSNAWNVPEANLESYDLCDVAYMSGSEEERTYIMHILSLSGLDMNGLIMAHSLSLEHGLDPFLFGRLESIYENRAKRDGILPFNRSSRRLLFDVVNEVVTSKLQKCFLQPWAKSSSHKILVYTGKQLLEQIFSHIRYHRFASSEAEEEILEDMAAKDLMTEEPWVYSECDTQSVVIQLERFISGDLIREIVHECVMRR